MGYRGYTESMEVLIDILDEQKKQTALLERLLENKEVNHGQTISSPKGQQHSSTRSKRSVDKPVGKRGAVQPHKRSSKE